MCRVCVEDLKNYSTLCQTREFGNVLEGTYGHNFLARPRVTSAKRIMRDLPADNTATKRDRWTI